MTVDPEAYSLLPQWISVGWHLWQAVPMGRDLFLTLPNHDWSHWVVAEARYTDAQAMSRSLLRSLEAVDHATTGEVFKVLRTPRAEEFWSEQSGRVF